MHPHSLAVQQHRVSFPLFECQVHQLPISPGAGTRDAWNPRPTRIPVQTSGLSSRPAAPSQGLAQHTFSHALGAQCKRSSAPQLRSAGPGRGRASPACDSGPLGPGVDGGRRDRPRPRGGSRRALCRQAWGTETDSGPSPFGHGRLPRRACLRAGGAALAERSGRDGWRGPGRRAGSASE